MSSSHDSDHHKHHDEFARPNLNTRPSLFTIIIFVGLLISGLLYTVFSISHDLEVTSHGQTVTNWLPFFLLGVALLIALGFEFVNGFHDTANAVATVIYTNSMPPNLAVVWSGFFNFLGVLLSSGLVAFGIISLLPVELILQVGSSAGFAMIFALLIAAIIWNLGTWWLGLPASSSHTLIGSIIGVGVANAMMNGRDGTSGVDWAQATKIGYSLLLSPLIGFAAAALLLYAIKVLIKNKELFTEPKKGKAPPAWIRGLLVLTCTGVSFAHGSNDGQKGMGLIMLILIGSFPTAYALNSAMTANQSTAYVALAEKTSMKLNELAPAAKATEGTNDREVLSTFVRTRDMNASVIPALSSMTAAIATQVKESGTFAGLPTDAVANVRNDMYLTSETIRWLEKNTPEFSKLDKDTVDNLKAFKEQTDESTKFIPLWVKIAVAIALGLGTMVGWKRIVITVGEKIGKTHLTYGQGASAELVAMMTIGAADVYGLPVSTTQVLSSGVAGTMVANGSGIRGNTIRSLALAWILTLPVAMFLSGFLFWLFSQIF
ncbi:inorganic phosphate transporter [Polynucleobacter sp. JS-Safj-400b-B2]|uniref:inorganic phosphate transporter n=1 Tax=Polynucleobacter sp. JS-Safj-400b-B2 TaxID=2576921 RepID=UPI001C0B221B|nr:inorganic phosphate transporter [Polynucleobacter sp. JS-Safj-400b-B2]MBU3626910.1 inorganic phosphate transporter [Polynucleobacter sp. JS-Safj-400b-B2]